MTDRTQKWLDLLRELDQNATEREREKIAAMTPEERDAYLHECFLHEMVNMP